MEPAGESADKLRSQIAKAEEELAALRAQLAALESAATQREEPASTPTEAQSPPSTAAAAVAERLSPERRKTGAPAQALQRIESAVWKWPLQEDEYERYGRQLVLPQIGITGTNIPRHMLFLSTFCVTVSLIFRMNRPAANQGISGLDRRRRRPGLSGCGVPRWCRRGHVGGCGR